MKITAITDAYRRSNRRLLLLDYDGVLAPIMPTPEEAAPTDQTHAMLEKLTADTRNTCVIVSGRPRATLEEWLGQYPVAFAAEHGLWRKEQGGEWKEALEVKTDWKQSVTEIMEGIESELPGSFVEEKHAGLAFHYRKAANPELQVEELIRLLTPVANTERLRIMHGKKVVEVVPAGVDKGTASLYWLKGDYDFILAVGDDTTDEALFSILPSDAYSLKIGEGDTAASHRLDTQAEFVDFITKL
ncbi:MAG: trehalose-phosphatase [Candidatus Saccharibacteria bacterium]|nr:MAG: trehalose-phosphatase [Candidatus Saccharibacteria bacterium]